MIFPALNLRSRLDPDDAVDRIERAINNRHYRLGAGISISDRFDEIRGALVVAQGNGRYLRVQHVVEAAAPIANSIGNGCREVLEGSQRDRGEITQLISDLAETQATVVEKLKCHAGKYVDRVLAVAVRDPGVWDRDFDGRISYFPFCDATRLAELSGVTVIDSFPSRDLAVGGSGSQLESLPYWVLFADRDRKVASQSRWLVSIDDHSCGYFLPASDGLDAEVPGIKTVSSVGCQFLVQLLHQHDSAGLDSEAFERLIESGRFRQTLADHWTAQANQVQASNESALSLGKWAAVSQQVFASADEFLQSNPGSLADVVQTAIVWIVEQCVEQFSAVNLGAGSATHENTRLIIACPAMLEPSCVRQFIQSTAGRSISTTSIDRSKYATALDPVVAALLGLFHIDQMPANIPWLTGATCQRILGRLTPGRPSNWRQLVRAMADFQPAPMKLRDAI